jgi:hypothetical protein
MIKENKDMDDILIPDKFSLDGIAPNMIEVKKLDKALLTIHADGRITVSEDLKPTETAAEVLKIMQDMWLSNQQVVKIKELQSSLNESNELIEHLRDKIKQLETSVSYWNERYNDLNHRVQNRDNY